MEETAAKPLFKGVSGFVETLSYCVRLSWSASRHYTAVRVGVQLVAPVLTILVSFAGKYLIDLLAEAWVVPEPHLTLLWLLGSILAISLARAIGQKAAQYTQSMHDQILNGKISLMIMDRSLTADLEYFDNADYHDKLMSATRDSSAIVQVLWNALSCVSSTLSFVGAFLVICRANPLYGVALTAAAVPSSVAAARYTKSLYRLSLEQIKGERKKSYYQSTGLDKWTKHVDDTKDTPSAHSRSHVLAAGFHCISCVTLDGILVPPGRLDSLR